MSLSIPSTMSLDDSIRLSIITLDNTTSYDSHHGDVAPSYGVVHEHWRGAVPLVDVFNDESSASGSIFNFESNSDAIFLSLGKILLGLLLSCFVLVAIAGNLLVIIAVLTDRGLRQTGNYFIVSLALADTLVAVAVMTFATANDVMGRWAFGARICRLWMSADVMCSTASILNLCAISADRYLHIRSPLHYNRLVTHRRCLAAIGFVWIMSALISFLPIHFGWHRITQFDSDSGTHINNTGYNRHLDQPPTPFNLTSTSSPRRLL